MKDFIRLLIVIGAFLTASPAIAQEPTVKVPQCLQVRGDSSTYTPCTGIVPVDTATGNAFDWASLLGEVKSAATAAVNATASLTVNAGDASAIATPVQSVDGSKIASEGQLNTVVTRLTTMLAKLDTLVTNLGTPMQANGSLGNTVFGATQSGSWGMGLSGSLPAFAATPTMNIGTMPAINVTSGLPVGAASDSTLSGIRTTLGSPFQAGGNIANTAFGATQSGTWNMGLTGTLPAFAATPTVNLGTIAGLATSAKQDAVAAKFGSPVQAGGTLSNVVQTVAADRSASIGTAAVTLMTANSARKGFSIQVQSQTATCYINGAGQATTDSKSMQLNPASYYEPDHTVPVGAISIICDDVSTPVYAREW